MLTNDVRQVEETIGSILKQKYTLERANSDIKLHRSPDQGYLYLPGAGFGNISLAKFVSFLPVGGSLSFPLCLPYLVPPVMVSDAC